MWNCKQSSQSTRENAWFVVVTRKDPAWGEGFASEHENYALTVKLSDNLLANHASTQKSRHGSVQGFEHKRQGEGHRTGKRVAWQLG